MCACVGTGNRRASRLSERLTLPENSSRTEPDSTHLRHIEHKMADEGVGQMSISEFGDDGDEDDAACFLQCCVRSFNMLHILYSSYICCSTQLYSFKSLYCTNIHNILPFNNTSVLLYIIILY